MSSTIRQLPMKDNQLNHQLPVTVEPIVDRPIHIQSPSRLYSPPYHRDYYVCTGCQSYSCGGIYSSVCTECKGVISNPPRHLRRHYLCPKCAHSRSPCKCDRPPPPPIFRQPPKYCWCSCCKCCTYSCSCSYCNFFCECLSAPCKLFEPCCYCTRICCPNEVCCQTRRCFWSWCPCHCSLPQSSSFS